MEDLLDIDLKEIEILEKFRAKKVVFEKRGKRSKKLQKRLKEREKNDRYLQPA